MNSSEQVVWPKGASSIKFQHKATKSKSQYCRILYVEERNRIDVLDWNDVSVILDSFQLEDVIGADLEFVAQLDNYDLNEIMIMETNIENVDANNWKKSKVVDDGDKNELVYDGTKGSAKVLLNIFSYPLQKDKRDRIAHHTTLEVISNDTTNNEGENENWTNVKSCVRTIR